MEAGDMNTPGHGMSGGVCTVHALLMLCTSLCGAGKIHGKKWLCVFVQTPSCEARSDGPPTCWAGACALNE